MPERANYPLDLGREMVKWFNNGFKEEFPTLLSVFWARPMTGPTERVAAMGGTTMFSEYNEEATAYEELPLAEGYDNIFTAQTYFAGFTFDSDLWEDLSPWQKLHASQQLGRAAGYTLQYLLAAWLDGLISGTSTGGDTLAIGHTAHTLKWGGTHGNKGTSAYGETVFATVRQALLQQVDDRGNIQPQRAYALVYGPGLWSTVRKTQDGPYTDANLQPNVARGGVPVEAENPWAASDDDWSVLPRPYEGGPCMLLVKKEADFVEGDDDQTRKHFMNSRMRNDIGGVDWRGSYISDVA